MGEFEGESFFASHMVNMRRMRNIMNSLFAHPIGLMGTPSIMDAQHLQGMVSQMPGMQMMPFGFPPMPSLSMGRMFSDLENMGQNPNCHSFTSSSIMTMTSSPDGRPQVYQESVSTRTAPGGVRETKKTVSDSVSGTRKMAIGHHIGEKAHIIEREQNYHNGDQEERQEFINLDEDEAESFNDYWLSKTKHTLGAVGNSSYRPHNPYSRGHQDGQQLALPSTAPSSSQSIKHSRPIATPRRSIRPSHSTRSNNAVSKQRSAESSSTITSSSTSSSSNPVVASPPESPQNLSTTNRKREYSPDVEALPSNKRHSNSSKSD